MSLITRTVISNMLWCKCYWCTDLQHDVYISILVHTPHHSTPQSRAASQCLLSSWHMPPSWHQQWSWTMSWAVLTIINILHLSKIHIGTDLQATLPMWVNVNLIILNFIIHILTSWSWSLCTLTPQLLSSGQWPKSVAWYFPCNP